MLFGSYDVTICFEEAAIIPDYSGSMLRGAFGAALKTTMCGTLTRDCRNCRIVSRCLYAKTFEPVEPPIASAPKANAIPPPYVIEPTLEPRRRFEPGETLMFRILLFGSANDFLPFFIHAFELMGRRGVGRRAEGSGGATFSLHSVTQEQDEPLYDVNTGRLLAEPVTTNLSVQPAGATGHGRLRVNLITPLRLKFMNHLQASLPFHIFVRAALRRVSSMFAAHGAGEPPLDYSGLVAQAGRVNVVASHTRWLDWERYSSRQKTRMLLGGIVGRIEYEGVSREFLPALEVARTLHIGKQTTFGLGLMDFEWQETRQ